ncbi:MAG: NAD-dependent succinate-semialdehyde dehydrogenase [Verrucomicrobiales bacterium]|nr:NAD-dependent succinate-semialdehyde dehydrogenase [Verrucomicrobiales bacterium]
MPLVSVNPATGEHLETHEEDSDEVLTRKLDAAGETARGWGPLAPAERAAQLLPVARLLRARRADYARLMALEMGKPITQGLAESDKCATACEHLVRHGAGWLAPETVDTEASYSAVHYEPLGTVLAIMPWNFPFWQVIRCAASALLAGNSVVLKHASNVTGCARALGALFRDAGLPEGLFQVLYTDSRRVVRLIEHPAVSAVSLTGSVAAGREVAASAGRALKKTVLELGGSDPYVILEDADVPAAARIAAQSRLLNSGQSCIAAKRLIVVSQVRDAFEGEFLAALQAARLGDPLDPATEIGPLARRDLRDELHLQVQRTIAQGARCALGGRLPPGPGAYYPPTALLDVRPGMTAFDEETFGPVAPITVARDEDEAITLANASNFGLGAAVFTRDLAHGRALAATAFRAGSCFVNALVRSDARLPFGGIQDSGYGRELSALGLREFTNIKTVYVA